jgi:hypothetical protein
VSGRSFETKVFNIEPAVGMIPHVEEYSSIVARYRYDGVQAIRVPAKD